jgi:capsular polysaccharide biosynthesis protein
VFGDDLKNPEILRFVDLLRRRWLVIVAVFGIGIIVLPLFALLTPPTHKATAKLLLVSQALKDTTEMNPDLPSIVTSTEVLDRVINHLNLNTNPTSLARIIKTKSPVKASSLELTYQDGDGVKAAAVANAIADESARYFHEVATRGYSDSLKALNEHIAASKAEITADDRLLQSKQAYASSDKVLDDLTSQIDELRAQRRQLTSSLAADRATAASLNRQLRDIDPIVRGEILMKDVVYQQTQSELAKDVADLNSERASFRNNFPGLAALAKRVERERSQLKYLEEVAVENGAGLSPSSTQTVLDRDHAAGAIAADLERLRATDTQLAGEQQRLQQVAGAGAMIGTLRAERSAALQQYLSLTQRLGTTQGDAAQAASLGTLVVVSRAVPVPPESQKELLVLGALLMLALAIGVAYGVDKFDRRLWGVHEIENVYGRPVLIEVGGKQ